MSLSKRETFLLRPRELGGVRIVAAPRGGRVPPPWSLDIRRAQRGPARSPNAGFAGNLRRAKDAGYHAHAFHQPKADDT